MFYTTATSFIQIHWAIIFTIVFKKVIFFASPNIFLTFKSGLYNSHVGEIYSHMAAEE
jgi:hypothetical protein